MFPTVVSTDNRTPPIRVLIAERNRMTSQLLAESLQRDSRFRVVGVSTAAELLSMATARKTDVAVISADFASAARKGLQVARALNAGQPNVRIVILLDAPTRESVIASFHSGARAVFCRTEPLCEFRACVESVSRGEIWAKSIETDYLLGAVRTSPSCDSIGSDKVRMLSNREIEVAEHAVQGQTNRQIAEQLRLSEHTIKNYLFRVFEKLGVSNRMELLFLLSAHNKNEVCHAVGDTAGRANCLEVYLKAAEEGSITDQFIVGLTYFEGRGVEKNEHSAYYWLRMAEENSSELRDHSRTLILELKAKMKSEDIQALEQSLMTRNGGVHAGERSVHLVNESVDVHKLAG
jgi:two-component system nitrate/nitrite response regulator NarL